MSGQNKLHLEIRKAVMINFLWENWFPTDIIEGKKLDEVANYAHNSLGIKYKVPCSSLKRPPVERIVEMNITRLIK